MSIKKRSFDAAIWNSIGSVSIQFLNFAFGIFLANIVGVEEYGLLAMIAVFIGFSNLLMGSGLPLGLIRKKKVSHEELSTVFWFNVGSGLFFYGLLFFGAPLISKFYDQPRLTDLVRFVSLNIVVSSFSRMSSIVMTRKLNFKTQAILEIPSIILSSTLGLYLAMQDFGAWALAIQSLAYQSIRTVLLVYYARFIPQIVFQWHVLRDLFKFSGKLLYTALIDRGVTSMIPLIIGKFYSAVDLGYYSRADNYQKLIGNNIMGVAQTVSLPALSAIQDNHIKLKEAYRFMIKTVMMVNTPVMVLFIVIAKPLIVVLISAKWLPCIPYLQLLCIAGIISPLQRLNMNIFIVKGRSDLMLRIEVVKKASLIAFIVITAPFGITSMIFGQIINAVFVFVLNSWYSKSLVGYSNVEQLKDVVYFLINSILAGLAAYCVYLLKLPLGDVLLATVQSFILGLVYYFLCYTNEKATLKELQYLLLNKLTGFLLKFKKGNSSQ